MAKGFDNFRRWNSRSARFGVVREFYAGCCRNDIFHRHNRYRCGDPIAVANFYSGAQFQRWQPCRYCDCRYREQSIFGNHILGILRFERWRRAFRARRNAIAANYHREYRLQHRIRCVAFRFAIIRCWDSRSARFGVVREFYAGRCRNNIFHRHNRYRCSDPIAVAGFYQSAQFQ